MDLQGTVIRPPSEADSVLLQVTLGCSHNRCTFCGAYRGKRFAFKPLEILESDLEFAARYMSRHRRVFLCDGDALIMPQARLRHILSRIREMLPWVTRVGTYANAKSLARKTDEELAELKALGLGAVYLGLESGDDQVLAQVNKGVAVADMVRQGRRARAAGFKLNVTVLLGLAGPVGSARHARLTGEALSAMDPEQVGALTLMLIPGTPLHADWKAGRFVLPGAREMLAELREMLVHTGLTRGLFLADHPSNYLPLKVRLPKDKAEALSAIDAALAGETPLRPEWQRGL